MLCRSTPLSHRTSGISLKTPLLVPSFSSKGFGSAKSTTESEISKIMAVAATFIAETCLVSAYDIVHGHLPQPRDLPVKPELMFVDSGGYEISTDSDYSTVIETMPERREWDVEMYKKLMSDWPQEQPTVFVSFDHPSRRVSLADQIGEARDLFKTDANHLHLFLIKPETEDQKTLQEVLKKAVGSADELSSFDIIGVTEKELGSKMLDRMRRIAKLRQALDEAGVKAPIHVFGALDPVSVMLYFISGAEIFDGLTWLRYGYHEGIATYTHNWGMMLYEVQTRDSEIKSNLISHNVYQLNTLQMSMQTFSRTGDFTKLAWHGKKVQKAWETLMTVLGLEE